MYLFELVAGDLCGPVTWSGATSAVAHCTALGFVETWFSLLADLVVL